MPSDLGLGLGVVKLTRDLAGRRLLLAPLFVVHYYLVSVSRRCKTGKRHSYLIQGDYYFVHVTSGESRPVCHRPYPEQKRMSIGCLLLQLNFAPVIGSVERHEAKTRNPHAYVCTSIPALVMSFLIHSVALWMMAQGIGAAAYAVDDFLWSGTIGSLGH